MLELIQPRALINVFIHCLAQSRIVPDRMAAVRVLLLDVLREPLPDRESFERTQWAMPALVVPFVHAPGVSPEAAKNLVDLRFAGAREVLLGILSTVDEPAQVGLRRD